MKKLIPWLGAAAIITLLFGTIYAVAQQSLRQTANEPETQLAEDAAAKLDQGAAAPSLISGRVDMKASLAPFVIIYNTSGHVVAGSGYLNGQIPVIPFGVLTHTMSTMSAKPNAVTWQPQPGVRLATVEVAARNYYVLAGRSLREVEKHENEVLKLSAFGWLVAIVVLGGAFTLSHRYT